MNMDTDMDMSNDEVDLSALILYNAATDTSTAFLVSSPIQFTIEAFPPVVPRPVSKRRGKKRSSRACTTCRLRKVRCNIVAHGAPCSNCRHDEIECVLPLSRRQRAARKRAEQSVCNSTVDSDAPSQPMEERCTSVTTQIPPSHSQSSSNLGPHGMSITEDVLSEILPTNAIALSPSSGNSPQATSSSRTKSWIQIQAPLASAPPPPAASSLAEIKIPQIFTPFPRHLDSHDLSYLHSRDALTLPSETLQIALLKAYISFIHPTTPILDLEEFLSAVKYGQLGLDGERGKWIEREMDGRKQIPFLLFQAVMLASVGVVSLRILREEGYLDRERAQRVFFNRVRLLYDFDTTTDRLSIIQSLLLVTLSPYPLMNPSANTSDKDSYHYLGLAISLSFSLGINRNLPPSASSNPRRKMLERRIWWTAFVRDRALALDDGAGFGGRPLRIKCEDCDVEMLSLNDFDLDLTSEEEGEEEMRARMAARECVEKVRLCWRSCDYGSVGNYLNMMSNHLQPAWMLQKQMQISIPRPQLQLQFQSQFSQRGRIEEQIYTGPTSSRLSNQPVEEIEYATTSTTPSMHSDCITPPPSQEPDFPTKVGCESPLGAGYGVDGKYDDYLEYLKAAKRETEEGKRDGLTRRCSAIQMDVKNGRMIEV